MHTRTCAALFALSMMGCDFYQVPQTPTASGEEMFQLCSQCHGDQGQGQQQYSAPSIAGLPQWYVEAQLRKFKSGARGTHPADITGMQMRPMTLSFHNEADLKTIAAYVSSMQRPSTQPVLKGGNASRGQAHYATCTACHQADGSGNEQLKAPPLKHASDWYMFEQLKKFKHGYRGTNAKDVEGALMRPMAVALPDEQAMKDVIAHITTFQ